MLKLFEGRTRPTNRTIHRDKEGSMKNQIKIAAIIAAIFGLASIALPVHAFTEGACKDDAQKLCGDVKPGDGKIKDCMKQHESELSEACKDNIAEGKDKFKEKLEEAKAACKQDIQQFCANVTPGQGREFACLKSYEDKISTGCKEKLPKRGMHKGMQPENK